MLEDPTPAPGTEQDPVIPQPTDPETPLAPEAPIEPAAPVEPQPQPAVPTPPAPAQPDLEQRYKHSSREAIVQKGRADMYESRLNQLKQEDTPTDAEIRAAYPDYDQYEPLTQMVIKDQLTEKKARMRVEAILIEDIADRKWQAELKGLAANPKYAKLKDDPDFEDFVLKPKHKGVDIETLARAYLFEEAPPVAPTPAPAPRDPGLEMGSGGPRGGVKTSKFTADEVTAMQQNDPKRYRELLLAGEFDNLGE